MVLHMMMYRCDMLVHVQFSVLACASPGRDLSVTHIED